MESYGFPAGGFQLPFQRRLSRLYNDTKKSSDFVKEPLRDNAEDPEIKSLHRKLRIQKDRLVSWGLEWSDPNHSAEIDEALSKAGLSEVVGSIMSTIKDVLAEAEPLWQNSRRLVGSENDAQRPTGDKKMPLVTWDKGRFEDLVRDLTTSIDTLYDLSRTRSSAAMSAQARARLLKGGSTEDLRAFESTRMQTPQQIDPQTLTNLRDMQPAPMSETVAQSSSRDVVFMSKQAYSELTHITGRQPYSPLLLEYADFDPMFSAVGIMPDMSRFEKLSSGLQTEPQRSPGSWTGLPRLLGYFEDMDHSRLGLVYQFPPTFNPVHFEHLTQNPLYNLCSLADLLARPDFEPPLEAKFRLAFNLANTVFDMHARGITHGNLVDANVSFCNTIGTEPEMGTGEVDVRRPLISSFDLFPDSTQEGSEGAATEPTVSLYRHPLDPKTTTQKSLLSNPDSKAFDLYSLSMLLLSIGLWTNLDNLANPASTAIPESVLDQLAIRCGTLYMKAVQTCWNAVDQELAGGSDASQVMARVQVKASRYLEACAILDSVGGLEERLSGDLGIPSPTTKTRESSGKTTASSSKDIKLLLKPKIDSPYRGKPLESTPQPDVRKGSVGSPAPEIRTESMVASFYNEFPELTETPAAPRSSSELKAKRLAKLRLFPHTALPPEAVEQWNKVLMPQMNQVLRHFYRKHPESVEMSLESIGESPRETRPTVLVVCTSVAKVRTILKRKMGTFFDGTTGFALKVCRGQVLRSRKRGDKRSMAGDDTEQASIMAANGGFQEKPHNGASIGAWVGDRHLPPVSFGGLVVVDDKTYGMTVHHMLDDPDQELKAEAEDEESEPALRSGAGSKSQPVPDLAAWYAKQYPDDASSADSSDTEDFAAEFSDTESDVFSESAVTSEDEQSDTGDDDSQYDEAGDIPGIEPGCGDGYIISQPALDDVVDGFFASPDTQDEEHLDTFSLGEMFASSGIRRRHHDDGLVHEIDWALFEFKEDRLPDDNVIPRASSSSCLDITKRNKSDNKTTSGKPSAIYPKSVVPISSLPNLEVQCMARTSGLQTGLILPTLTSVKIYGRASPSHTYQVSGTPATPVTPTEEESEASQGKFKAKKSRLPLGIPGDSGAWVVERRSGQVCGHVLAWSGRKRVAYICPMDVLLLDIAETLEAAEVKLPGGEAVIRTVEEEDDQSATLRAGEIDEGFHDAAEGFHDAPELQEELDESDVDVPQLSMAAPKRKPVSSGGGSPPAASNVVPVRAKESPGCDLAGKIARLSLRRKDVGVLSR